jgi:AraC-like DNA-binding protein
VAYGGDAFEAIRRPGDCLLAPADTALAYEPEKPSDLLILLLPAQTIRTTLAEQNREMPAGSFGRLHSGLFRSDIVAALCRGLWEEALHGDGFSRLFIDQAVRSMIFALFREAGERFVAPELKRGSLAPWQERRTCEYLLAHLEEEVSLDQLAASVGLSAAHFCRAFKRSTGVPPHRWQLSRRVERAQTLLTDTDLPLIEVAAQVGYNDPNQLGRVFRKHLGTSPGRFRREHRR